MIGKQLTLVLTAVSLSVLLVSGQVSNATDPAADKVSDERFHLFMRPSLGYFHNFPQSSPYSGIYEKYFESVVQKNDDALKSVHSDDWRRFRPTADLCINLLIGLQVKEYILSKPYDIIPLDACLEWLYDESSEKKLDQERMSYDQLHELKLLLADKELERIYNGTQFKELDKKVPQAIQHSLYEYLTHLLQVYTENMRSGCHSIWLEAYNDFVENILLIDCQEENESKCLQFGYEAGPKDSYLKLITDSTVWNAQTCYKVMQNKQMHGLVEAEYEASKNVLSSSFAKTFKSKRDKVMKQSEAQHWSRDLIGILQLVSGTDLEQPIHLGKCVTDLNKIKEGDKETVDQFTQALSMYALENVDLKNSLNDPSGRMRYGRAVTKLCRHYTNPKYFLSKTGGVNTDDDDDERKPFGFYGIIYSLVRLTNHEKIFGISKEQFEEDVIRNGWEALYLTTFSCQIISVTWGELTTISNEEQFEVKLRPNAKLVIDDWPLAQMTQRLSLLYPEEHQGMSMLGLPQGALFGRKLKLFGKSKSPERPSGSDQVAVDHNKLAPVPAQAPAQQEPAALAPSMPTRALSITKPAPVNNNEQAQSGAHESRTNKFLSLFGRHKKDHHQHQQPEQQQQQQQPGSVFQQQAQEPKPASSGHVMSKETLEMFKKIKGYYPDAVDKYKQIYPDLPEDTKSVSKPQLNQPLFSSQLGSANSLYNSRDWQEIPSAKKEKKEKKVKKQRRPKKRYDDDDDDDDRDRDNYDGDDADYRHKPIDELAF